MIKANKRLNPDSLCFDIKSKLHSDRTWQHSYIHLSSWSRRASTLFTHVSDRLRHIVDRSTFGRVNKKKIALWFRRGFCLGNDCILNEPESSRTKVDTAGRTRDNADLSRSSDAAAVSYGRQSAAALYARQQAACSCYRRRVYGCCWSCYGSATTASFIFDHHFYDFKVDYIVRRYTGQFDSILFFIFFISSIYICKNTAFSEHNNVFS